MNKKLNIACGGRYSKDWINIDFHAESVFVKKVNILKGLPFSADSLDVAYSSHFLEHLSPESGNYLIKEIYRVLKIGGVIRIVVPDLENICKEYLLVLDEVAKNDSFEKKYQWLELELLDQLTRDSNGGYMGKMFNKVRDQKDEYMASYILERIGEDLITENKILKRKITIGNIYNKLIYTYIKFIKSLMPKNLKQLVATSTSIGEKHKWMYDRYSLYKLLSNAGFKDVSIKSYNTSGIENFNNYQLDIKADGTPYKGKSSIYIEAIK